MRPRIVSAFLALAVLCLLPGCGHTKAQRVLHKSTDSLGLSVNAAHDAMAEFMTQRALAELGPTAAAPEVMAWIQAQPEWQKTRELYTRFFAVYELWVKGNAAAVSGDTVLQLDVALVLGAARDLFAFVGEYVPQVKGWLQ